ncbi:MAG: hypothetical protein FJ122_13060 [Deltaproteobacteria bacterium]|nr:hypothetical protein [Deltaproteobacteria bacterium]
MKWILEKLKEADGYVMVSPVSSGHLNALFKTFLPLSMASGICSYQIIPVA